MSDLRQEQIDRLNSRIDYLERDSAKAIADKKAAVAKTLETLEERYEKEEGKRSPYEYYKAMQAALERDGQEWLRIEKEFCKAAKEMQEKLKATTNDMEQWLTGEADEGEVVRK